MKFSVASVLALAAAAFAAPAVTDLETRANELDPRGTCKNVVCTDGALLVVAANLQLDVDVKADLGIISLAADVDLGVNVLAILAKYHKCKAVYCCPSSCETGKPVPSTCRKC